MAGKMRMGARTEVAKAGREMELLWVSWQQERGLQHGWVGDAGKGGGKGEPSKGWSGQGRTGRCSAGEAPCEGGKGEGWG